MADARASEPASGLSEWKLMSVIASGGCGRVYAVSVCGRAETCKCIMFVIEQMESEIIAADWIVASFYCFYTILFFHIILYKRIHIKLLYDKYCKSGYQHLVNMKLQ